MKLKRNQLVSWCAEIIENAQWVMDHAAQLADRANADVDDGIAGRSYDGDGRGGSTLSALERRALSDREDVVAQQMADLMRALDAGRVAGRAQRRWAGALLRANDKENRDREAASAIAAAARSIGAGYCVNCNHFCAGTANDRLRSGRCDPCRRYRERHHGMDRPRELWGDDAVVLEDSARGDGGAAA